MDIRLNRDYTYTARLDNHSRLEINYRTIKDLILDSMNKSTDDVKTSTRDMVQLLYSLWYDVHTKIDEDTLEKYFCTINDEDIDKITTIYRYLFSKENKMTIFRDNYESFKEYNDFYKNTFDFDVDVFKEANPAAFI